jgi:glycerol-3-phosphate dehydrogenase (NAD(P)+)
MAAALPIVVWGAGAWGTALAVAAAPRHRVLLWARDAAQADEMRRSRRNARYLPEVALPESLHIGSDLDQARRWSAEGLAIIGAPTAGLRERLAALPDGARVLWLSKGFEKDSGALGHEIGRAHV